MDLLFGSPHGGLLGLLEKRPEGHIRVMLGLYRSALFGLAEPDFV